MTWLQSAAPLIAPLAQRQAALLSRRPSPERAENNSAVAVQNQKRPWLQHHQWPDRHNHSPIAHPQKPASGLRSSTDEQLKVDAAGLPLQLAASQGGEKHQAIAATQTRSSKPPQQDPRESAPSDQRVSWPVHHAWKDPDSANGHRAPSVHAPGLLAHRRSPLSSPKSMLKLGKPKPICH